MCLALRRRARSTTSARRSRTCSRCSRRRGSREGEGPAEAEVARRLARRRPCAAGPCQEVVLTGDDVDLGLLPVQTLLAGRRGAVHHAPGRDHARPADRRPQRRHVPDAGDRPALDVHALADPQGRARWTTSPTDGRLEVAVALGLDPVTAYSASRAAAEARRRAHARRLPARRAGRARAGEDGRPRGARATPRSCSRATSRPATLADEGPVRRPHRLLHGASSRSRSSTSRR